MKKRIALILIAILLIAAGSIHFCMKSKVIDKSYNGFYVNTQTKEVLGKCDVRIKIRYEKTSISEFGKILKYYGGTLSIDDEEYDFKGKTDLNDENEYYKNDEGKKLIGFGTEEKDGFQYVFCLYEEFKDDLVYIRKYDGKFSNDNNIEIIATNNDYIDEKDIR